MQAAAFLKQATHTLHRQTEALAFGSEIMEKKLDLEQYTVLIDKNLYLHQYLEPSLADALSQFSLSDFLTFLTPRTPALQADAALLGLQRSEFSVTPPFFSSREASLGGVYVLLGSHLGGKVIYRAMRGNPYLSRLPEFHFYAASDQYPVKEWPRFCHLLDDHLRNEQQLEAAAAGAQDTFSFFHEVYASSLTPVFDFPDA